MLLRNNPTSRPGNVPGMRLNTLLNGWEAKCGSRDATNERVAHQVPETASNGAVETDLPSMASTPRRRPELPARSGKVAPGPRTLQTKGSVHQVPETASDGAVDTDLPSTAR